MPVTILFWSGKVVTFLVPESMLVADFQALAEGVGGKIRGVDFDG